MKLRKKGDIQIILLLILSVLIFSGCSSYKSFTIQTLQPADVALPPGINDILFVNNTAYLSYIPVDKRQDRSGNNFTAMYDTLAVKEILYGALDVLVQSPRFTVVEPYYFDLDNPQNNLGALTRKLQESAKNYEIDALVVLDEFYMYDSLTVMFIEHYNYWALRATYTVLNFKIYDVTSNKIIDNHVLRDTLYWDATGTSAPLALSNLPADETIIQEAAYHAGNRYGLRLSPIWVEHERFYYTRGNLYLRNAARLIEQDRWDAAAKLWMEALKVTEKYLLARVAYNLAIYHELNDELETALEYAAKSYNASPSRYNYQYIKLIEDRIEKKNKIVKQFLGE